MFDDKLNKNIESINIDQEIKQSYLDYAMSVIIGRALPDVRDGLKPVHRRILFAMKELSNEYNKPYKKSARVVGDVIGKYHPHGDSAVYDSIVRMAQSFSLRYVLIDGQGNFGSVDGDSPAAMRYTEIRMSCLSQELLSGIDEDTVDFFLNYDGTEYIPEILPSHFPNLLVNGSSGIAVGMATNIPPHNLTEVINATIALINNNHLTTLDLMKYIPGPDFPTGGYIDNSSSIFDAYNTGKGKIIMRAKSHIVEDDNNIRNQILITEIPYQINKSKLINQILDLMKNKKIDGITELRDESDKDGLRIVIDVKKNFCSQILLNNLYAQTYLQYNFNINMVALVNNRPKVLNLKDILQCFIDHKKCIVTRRTIYRLKKYQDRLHILEGLIICLFNINDILLIIKKSKNINNAKELLISSHYYYKCKDIIIHNKKSNNDYYKFSISQVNSILDLRLHKLTNLEKDKMLIEYNDLVNKINDLNLILNNKQKLYNLIIEELQVLKNKFGDDRKSIFVDINSSNSYNDLMPEEMMVVTQSYDGYVKRQPLSDYKVQHRGGKGKIVTQIKSRDFIDNLIITSSHDKMLLFSTFGKVYLLKVHNFPLASRIAKGKPINNVLPLDDNEKITAMLSLNNNQSSQKYVCMSTKKGVVKRINLSLLSNPRKKGICALKLSDGDELRHVSITDGSKELMLFSDTGKAIRFNENDVRVMGRTARGVKGMMIGTNSNIVSLLVANNKKNLLVLTVTKNGYGKRTPLKDYRLTARGLQGVISISTSDRNGKVIAAGILETLDDVILVTNMGTLVRINAKEIRQTRRSTQGVKLINLKENEYLVAAQICSNIDSNSIFNLIN